MLKDKQILEFTSGFHIMIKSGVSISEALNLLHYEFNNRKLKNLVLSLNKSIERGDNLTEALKKTKGFPSLYIHLISVGEETGEIADVLLKLMKYYEKSIELKRNVLSKAIYPIIVLLLIIVISFGFVNFILPMYQSINASMGAKMPAITIAFVDICYFIKNYIVYIIFCCILIALCIKFILKKEQLKLVIDKALLKVPFIKKYIFYSNINIVLYAQYLMISSGINILYSIKLSSACIKNMQFKKVLNDIEKDVTNGQSIGSSIKKYRLPHKLVYMISTGEYTGQLEQNIKRLHEIYEGEAKSLRTFSEKLIEPVTTMLLAVIVGFLLIAIIKPAYSVLNNIKQ